MAPASIFDRSIRKFGKLLGYEFTKIPTAGASRQRTIYQIHHHNRCFYSFSNSPITDRLLVGEDWDANLKTLVQEALQGKTAGTVVEVGANIGASLLPICTDFSEIQFKLYEPVPDYFALLQRNLDSFGANNVEIKNIAIADHQTDSVDIFCNNDNAGAWVYGSQLDKVQIEAAPLDRLLPLEEQVLFMKIDVDGYETGVLRGSEAVLKKWKPPVFFEFSRKIMAQLKIDPKDLLNFLVQCGLTNFAAFKDTGELIETTANTGRIMEIAAGQTHYIDLYAHSTE